MKLTCDLFLITWPGDYQWLPYLFRSIAKHVTGFERLVIVIEDGDELPREALEQHASFPWAIKRCRRYRGTEYEGRSGQSLEKLRAWYYTDADRVLFIDSDCVFVSQLNLKADDVVTLDKPTIWHSPWSEVGDALCWYAPTKEILRMEPPAETMRRFPFVFPGWFLRALWEHVGGEERLRTFPETCDFNVMGNFAATMFPQFFNVKPTSECNARQIVRNFWSFHGANYPEVVAEVKKLGLLP